MNIVPTESPNKGEALLLLLRHAGARRAVFIGDDLTDEDVFRLKNPCVLGIRVGNSSLSEAAYRLSDQNGMGRLLDCLVDALERAQP